MPRPSTLPLPEALAELVAHGEDALARTPEQLETLREAGVVDAGGAGLLELVRGIAAHVRGEPLPAMVEAYESLPHDAVHQELSRFRYCTSFYVEGEDADPDALERELEQFGDSLLVVGSRGAVKAHVHTDDPGRALGLATAMGVIAEVDVKNMHMQIADREERLTTETTRCGVVAVCAGAGNAALFAGYGARVVEGGQTMNPPTSELVAAIESVAADEVVLLPNNKNVVLAAEQAAAAASRPTVVVPTHTLQAGLAAVLAFDPVRGGGRELRRRWPTRPGACARARSRGRRGRRRSTTSRWRRASSSGSWTGARSRPATELDAIADEVVARLLAEPADVADRAPRRGCARRATGLATRIAAAHPDVELEVVDGGQPHYPLLFGAE